MSLLRTRKGLKPAEHIEAKGLMYQDKDAVTTSQRQCMNRLGVTIQMEQEAYLHQHPEVITMLKLFVSKMVQSGKRNDNMLKKAGQYFSRPINELAKEIEEFQTSKNHFFDGPQSQYQHDDLELGEDLFSTIVEHYPPAPWQIPSSVDTSTETASSSFLSVMTSDTTLPTPEHIPTPEPTVYETLYSLLSNTVDKAVYFQVDDETLRYDTAYVELMKAVDDAMEEQVKEIREDIAMLLFNAFHYFELILMEKEKIAAQIAWEHRVRKKTKKTLRRTENFKGWETPPSTQGDSHDVNMRIPVVPCVCHPHYDYNRYPKDRFGIYLPRPEKFRRKTVTVSPVASLDDMDTKSFTSQSSVHSVKSAYSRKSLVSRKSFISGKSAVSRKSVGGGKSVAIQKKGNEGVDQL